MSLKFTLQTTFIFAAWISGTFLVLAFASEDPKEELLLLTVASNKTDGFQRYLRSASIYKLNGKVIGLGEPWLGGDLNFAGGGYKVNLLRKELAEHKDKENLVILFTDAYDVILTATADEILSKFKKFHAKIVFGAEGFCWPKESLAEKYPEIELGKRYLNSGGFIGYAKDLFEMVAHKELGDKDDDQLYYTEIYLDPALREKWRIKLDHKSTLFQNLNGAVGEVELRFKDNEPYLLNTVYDTQPSVVHGNGPSKKILNHLGNYLAKAWNKEDQCTACWEKTIDLSTSKKKGADDETPQVVLAIFIEQPTPFLDEFLDKILKLDYPKSNIDLFIHLGARCHADTVGKFKKTEELAYHSVRVLDEAEEEWAAREEGLNQCSEVKCDYYFSVDADAHLDNPHTLRLLMEQNRRVIAPMLVRPYKAWSNFWGALTSEGFYARSTDYMDIVQHTRRGLWNVPYISSSYLIHGSLIHGGSKETRPSFASQPLDPDMAFCHSLRESGTFFYVSNRIDWGHLISADDFNATNSHPELWELTSNQFDWEQRYLHPNYSLSLEEGAVHLQPCPDVFWFPIVTERFADELVRMMEKHGKWSDGTNSDPRLDGGYENVPTIDIHMNQVGYEKEWLLFIDRYVRPLQEKVPSPVSVLRFAQSDQGLQFKTSREKPTIKIFDQLSQCPCLSKDSRIEGGYEAVPTRDIHMRQVGLEDQWLEFLRLYVKPLVEGIFAGFHSDPPRALMNFVVRYKPDEQPFLRPHHDSSTYTINIALNNAGVDYKGGGCNFIRYNCSVPDTKKGWMLLHPGRLTHYHEGLLTTEGTRYIMISFIDP